MVVACRVVPGASRTELKGTYGAALRVRVAAPPEGGRANAALCRLLEGTVGGRAELLSGAASRDKRVLLRDVTRREAEEALGARP